MLLVLACNEYFIIFQWSSKYIVESLSFLSNVVNANTYNVHKSSAESLIFFKNTGRYWDKSLKPTVILERT